MYKWYDDPRGHKEARKHIFQQVLLELNLLSFQMIPLEDNHESVQLIGTKGGDLP